MRRGIGSRGIGSRLARLTVVGMLAASGLVAGPAAVLADHSESQSSVQADVGCGVGVPGDECQELLHESPSGVHEFAVTDQRSGGGDRISVQFRASELYDPDGELDRATITGHLETGASGGGNAQATADYSIDLEDPTADVLVAGNMSATLAGSDLTVSDVDFTVTVECANDTYEFEVEGDAGASEPNTNSKNGSFAESVSAAGGSCSIDVSAFVDSATNRPAQGQSGSATIDFQVTISVGGEVPDCNGVSGTVRDGTSETGHRNPLRGVRVELRRDGQQVRAESTDPEGKYCFRSVAGTVDPGNYDLRVTLVDAAHSTPLFETWHRDSTEAVFIEVPITPEDFGPDELTDVEFATTSDRPWLPDVANIHWQTERFVRWVTDVLQLTPDELGRVKVVAFNNTQTYSYYDDDLDPPTVFIKENLDASLYATRDEPEDRNPDNAEWHEYAHHVGDVLGIGDIKSQACSGRTAHGGWTNATTCDSIAEGFAMFLPTLASMDIEAGRAGFEEPQYGDFFNAEDNGFKPWSVEGSEAEPAYREDMAVAQLLWDLADSGAELLDVEYDDVAAGVHSLADTTDKVALGGVELVRAMAAADPNTVVDVFNLLASSPIVPANLKDATVDLNGDDVAEASGLAELFLSHGFHPIRDAAHPRLTLGDVFIRTDHVPAGTGFTQRPSVEEVRGSGLLLQNPGANAAEVAVEVVYPTTTSHFTVAVPAGGERVLHLELPPYWSAALAPGAEPPPCDAETDYRVSIRLQLAGSAPKTIESCEFLQAVAKATGETAMTVALGDGAAPPGSAAPSGSPTAPEPAAATGLPIGMLVVVAVVVVVLVVGGVVLARRRTV